jgi:putative membrane protein
MEPKKILIHLLVTTGIIYALATYNLIPGIVIGGFYSALVVASLMGLLSVAARTFLVTFHVPVILLTLWIFALVLNTAVLWFISKFMDPSQFQVESLLAAFLAALVVSLAQSVVHKITS